MTARSTWRATLGLALLAALTATVLTVAPAARAAFTVTFAPSDGTVGTAMNLRASVSSDSSAVSGGKVVYYAEGRVVATASVDSSGTVAAVSWTPRQSGTVDMYAAYETGDGRQQARSSTRAVTIDRAPTTTTLSMPAVARTGSTVTITATVTDGSYVPTGSVTFRLGNGTLLTADGLDSKGVASISVQLPAEPSTYRLTARYNGDSNASPSTSQTGSTVVNRSGSNVELSVSSGTLMVGRSVTLIAVVTPSSATGTVTFQAGSTVLGKDDLDNGRANYGWTPATPGEVTLTATYRRSGSSDVAGTDMLRVTVGSLPADVITVGAAGQPPWPPRAGYPLRNAASVTVVASSASGAPVSLSLQGPCVLSGTTVTATTGAGSCTLTSSTKGQGPYGPGSQVNFVTLIRGRQTATLVAPAPGTLTRGTTYRLATPGTVTSAGNPVTWRATFAPKRCRVIREAVGGYALQARRTGRCNVRAYSPGVPGLWLRFKRTFRYTVRP